MSSDGFMGYIILPSFLKTTLDAVQWSKINKIIFMPIDELKPVSWLCIYMG